MKNNISKKLALFSALTLCLTASIPFVSAEDTSTEIKTTQGYNPGLPEADGVTEVDEERAEELNEICSQLKENVYNEYEEKIFHKHSLSVSLLVGQDYVIYESDDEMELYAGRKYCVLNGIDESNVWFKYSGILENNDVFAAFPDEEDDMITDHTKIYEMLTEFINEKGIYSASFFDSKEEEKVQIIYSYNSDKAQNQLIRDFIIDNRISRNSLEFLMLESSYNADTTVIAAASTDTSVALIYGDLNSDGVADLTDLSLLSLYLLDDISFDAGQIKAADVQFDEIIDIADLARLKQYVCKEDIRLGR